MLHRIKVYPAKRQFLATLGLSLVTSVGFVLAFGVLDTPDVPWHALVVWVAALVVPPFLAGWLSPRLSYVAFFPASLLVGLTVAETVTHRPVSYDSDPFFFIPLLTIIYGGWASVTFFGGWMAHSVISHLKDRK